MQLQECTVIPYHAAVSHITKRFMSYCYINCHITTYTHVSVSVSLTHSSTAVKIALVQECDSYQMSENLIWKWAAQQKFLYITQDRVMRCLTQTHDECVINCECSPQ